MPLPIFLAALLGKSVAAKVAAVATKATVGKHGTGTLGQKVASKVVDKVTDKAIDAAADKVEAARANRQKNRPAK